MNPTYNINDPATAGPIGRALVVDHLNTLGKADGNSFSEQNGNPVNFDLVYTVNTDGQDRYTGSLRFEGWGHGYLNTFSTQYPYTHIGLMLVELSTRAYEYIHNGWQSNRPGCENPLSGTRRDG